MSTFFFQIFNPFPLSNADIFYRQFYAILESETLATKSFQWCFFEKSKLPYQSWYDINQWHTCVTWFKYFVLRISSTNLVKTNWPQIPISDGLYPVDDMFPCWLVDMMTSSHIVLVVFSSRLIYHTYVTEIQTWYYTLICFHLFLVLKPFHNIKWSLMGWFLNWRNIFIYISAMFNRFWRSVQISSHLFWISRIYNAKKESD